MKLASKHRIVSYTAAIVESIFDSDSEGAEFYQRSASQSVLNNGGLHAVTVKP
jgi:hypothetical protein